MMYAWLCRSPLRTGRRSRRVPAVPCWSRADLADLRGPVTGTVELPLWLFWSPDRTFDLDDPATLRWMYQTVLREAARPEDLADYLDGDTLAAVWPDLFLPRGVRQAWEDRFPVLGRRRCRPRRAAV